MLGLFFRLPIAPNPPQCLSSPPSPHHPQITIFCHFSPFFATKNHHSHIIHFLLTFVHHFSLIFSHLKHKKAIVNNTLRWLILYIFNGYDVRDGDDGGDVRLRDCAQRGSPLLHTPRPHFQAPMSRAKCRAPSILHVFCA